LPDDATYDKNVNFTGEEIFDSTPEIKTSLENPS
jgi:hypothetical protein